MSKYIPEKQELWDELQSLLDEATQIVIDWDYWGTWVQPSEEDIEMSEFHEAEDQMFQASAKRRDEVEKELEACLSKFREPRQSQLRKKIGPIDLTVNRFDAPPMRVNDPHSELMSGSFKDELAELDRCFEIVVGRPSSLRKYI